MENAKLEPEKVEVAREVYTDTGRIKWTEKEYKEKKVKYYKSGPQTAKLVLEFGSHEALRWAKPKMALEVTPDPDAGDFEIKAVPWHSLA